MYENLYYNFDTLNKPSKMVKFLMIHSLSHTEKKKHANAELEILFRVLLQITSTRTMIDVLYNLVSSARKLWILTRLSAIL